ncbi:hypothetical protein [Bradyrhizobium sp. ORS 111]
MTAIAVVGLGVPRRWLSDLGTLSQRVRMFAVKWRQASFWGMSW